jgi:hypothetical protein
MFPILKDHIHLQYVIFHLKIEGSIFRKINIIYTFFNNHQVTQNTKFNILI